MRLTCRECGKELRVPDSSTRRRYRCPGCNTVQEIGDFEVVLDEQPIMPPSSQTIGGKPKSTPAVPMKRPAGRAAKKKSLPIWKQPILWISVGAGSVALIFLLFLAFSSQEPAKVSRGQDAVVRQAQQSIQNQAPLLPISQKSPLPVEAKPAAAPFPIASQRRSELPQLKNGINLQSDFSPPRSQLSPPANQPDKRIPNDKVVAATERKDEVALSIENAKAQHATKLDSLSIELTAAIESNVKDIAASGNLQLAKDALAEKEAWTQYNTLPKSANLSIGVKRYLDGRRAASAELNQSYKAAIAAYTKQIKLEQATAIEKELTDFIVKEKEVLAPPGGVVADANNGQGKKEADNQVAEEKSFNFAEFIEKMQESVDQVAAENTSVKRDAAYRALLDRLDKELRTKTLAFHFPISDIEKDRYHSEYALTLDVPKELNDVAGQYRRLGYLRLAISEEDAAKINKGDLFVISGMGRIADAKNDVSAANVLHLLTVFSNQSSQDFFVQNFTRRIVRDEGGAEGQKVVLDMKLSKMTGRQSTITGKKPRIR